jgi:hypothetical protein
LRNRDTGGKTEAGRRRNRARNERAAYNRCEGELMHAHDLPLMAIKSRKAAKALY